MREKGSYSELFWSAFSRIRIEYGERYHYNEYRMSIDVSEGNENISTSTSRNSCRTSTDLLKICFIFNNRYCSDTNNYNKSGIGRFDMYCTKQRFIEWSKNYEAVRSVNTTLVFIASW